MSCCDENKWLQPGILLKLGGGSEEVSVKFCYLNHPTDGIKKHIGTLGKQVCRGTLHAFQCYALLNNKIMYHVFVAATSNS